MRPATTLQHRTASLAGLACASLLAACPAIAAEAHVQRQLEQRDQSQKELRLKMQQQVERAVQPPQNPTADLQRRQLERDQQQRLQQLHEQQSRRSIPAEGADVSEAQREIERLRASQAESEQLKQFEIERRFEAEKSSRTPAP